MAKARLMSGGVGGVDSDDVTARREHVLQGYTALTSDSNDEPVQGTIPHRGTWSTASEVVSASGESTVHVRFEEGYYNKDGHYKPTVKIPYAVLSNVLGIDANKMLDSLTVAGVRGTIPIRGYRGPDSAEMWLYPQEGGYVVRIEEGYYHMGGNGQWKPYVIAPTSLVKSAINYHPEATLNNTTTCGEQGTIKMINTQDSNYRLNKSTAFGIDGWSDRNNPVFWIDFPHGNAFYHRADNHPHVCIDAVNLGTAGADSVLSGQTATSVQGVKFAGAIPRWICTTGDVISAVNNEGFTWDDIYAGRGRGIVMKILNGGYIQGANYVFVPSPNLYPHNVVKDVNINGTIGTRDFVDKVNEYMVATNVEISMSNREQVISLGNAYSGSETVFFGVDLVGEDVYDGFVRRDKGNGHYLIGRIPVSKSDSNLIGTYIRNVPVQIEIIRDGAGNISLVHHGPNQVLGATKLNIYIYAHSSISFRF